MSGPVAERAHREHDGHFDQNANHSSESSSGIGSKQGDGHRNGQLKEVAGSDESSRGGDTVFDPQEAHEPVGKAGIEIDLDDNWHRDEQNGNPPLRQILRLECKDQD